MPCLGVGDDELLTGVNLVFRKELGRKKDEDWATRTRLLRLVCCRKLRTSRVFKGRGCLSARDDVDEGSKVNTKIPVCLDSTVEGKEDEGGNDRREERGCDAIRVAALTTYSLSTQVIRYLRFHSPELQLMMLLSCWPMRIAVENGGVGGGKRSEEPKKRRWLVQISCFAANRAAWPGPCFLDPWWCVRSTVCVCVCVLCVLQGDIVSSRMKDGDWINKQELHLSFDLFFVSSGSWKTMPMPCERRRVGFHGSFSTLMQASPVPRMRCASPVFVFPASTSWTRDLRLGTQDCAISLVLCLGCVTSGHTGLEPWGGILFLFSFLSMFIPFLVCKEVSTMIRAQNCDSRQPTGLWNYVYWLSFLVALSSLLESFIKYFQSA